MHINVFWCVNKRKLQNSGPYLHILVSILKNL